MTTKYKNSRVIDVFNKIKEIRSKLSENEWNKLANSEVFLSDKSREFVNSGYVGLCVRCCDSNSDEVSILNVGEIEIDR